VADITDLTVRELNILNKRLGTDAVKAVADGTEHRWTAIALSQWLLAKRSDPAAAEDTYLDMTIEQLGALREDEDETDAGPTDPTPSP
jgi:hypothetical protein